MTITAEPATQAFTTRPIHPTFGLEISGLDITRPLDPATVATLSELVTRHKVLVFKGQAADTAKLNAFAAHFGDTDQEGPAVARQNARSDNVTRLGTQESGARPNGYSTVAEFWHTDSSWRPVPTWLSVLAAAVLPEEGAGTAFADMGAAWEALPEDRKAFLEGKQMVHDFRSLRRCEPSIPEMGDAAPPPVSHPLVRTIEGRKSLFLNGHTCFWVGNMKQDEGEALFKELMAHATQPQFVYEHRWAIGDVAMWDNRTTMHRGMPHDWTKPRAMYRAEVIGTEAP